MRAGLPAALALFSAGTVSAGTHLPAPATDPTSGIRISITSFFREPPLVGVIPLQVRIENASRRAGTWELRFTSTQSWSRDRLDSRHELRVEAGADRTFDLMVPLVPRPLAVYLSRQLNLTVSGPGVIGAETLLSNRMYTPARHSPGSSPGTPPSLSPYTGMSEGLHAANWERLGEALGKTGHELIGSPFDVAFLPAAWQGYTSFASLWMTDEEWRAMAPGPRRAVLEWVGLGGSLQIAAPAGRPPGGDVPSAGTSRRHGFGRIAGVARAGSTLADLEAATKAVLDDVPALHSQLDRYEGWSLSSLVGQPSLPVKRIVLFLGGYGLVLAPLNLFFCHRSRRRERLFWTTPLISVAVAGALAALILFQDGTGGSGRRFTAIFVAPEEHQAFVVQEQVARTGAIVSGRFLAGEPLLIDCLSLQGRTSGPMYVVSSGGRGLSYSIDSSRFDGDWFTNRSVQGHFLETVRPTRARVEIGARSAKALEVTSTFGGTLDELFVVDTAGGIWRGTAITAGRKAQLSPATAGDFDAFWMAGLAQAGVRGRALLEPLRGLEGHFFAWASGEGPLTRRTGPEGPLTRRTGPEGPIETSHAIRWQQEKLLLVGTGSFPVGSLPARAVTGS